MASKGIELDIADTIMERPQAFTVAGRRFCLHKVTLGKSYLLFRLMEELGVDAKIVKANPYMEALRLCREKKDIVCRLLAYHTMDSKEELLDSKAVDERSSFFNKKLTEEEMAQLLSMTLAGDRTEDFIKHFGIDRDREELTRISSVKSKNGNTVTFGGRSIYGFIDYFCERYGWTMEYVVWGIGYVNLQMLKADAVTSVYLTDKEKKETGIDWWHKAVSADDPANATRIMEMFK